MEKIARQSRLLNALGALVTRTSRIATRRTILQICAVIAASLLVVVAAAWFVAPPVWLAPGLALAALGVALLCANKLKLLEFLPEVLAGDVILPRPGRLGGDVKLLLPLQFVNGGTAGGVIQWVALRLTVDSGRARSALFSPVAAVDMQRFPHPKRRKSTSATGLKKTERPMSPSTVSRSATHWITPPAVPPLTNCSGSSSFTSPPSRPGRGRITSPASTSGRNSSSFSLFAHRRATPRAASARPGASQTGGATNQAAATTTRSDAAMTAQIWRIVLRVAILEVRVTSAPSAFRSRDCRAIFSIEP